MRDEEAGEASGPIEADSSGDKKPAGQDDQKAGKSGDENPPEEKQNEKHSKLRLIIGGIVIAIIAAMI